MIEQAFVHCYKGVGEMEGRLWAFLAKDVLGGVFFIDDKRGLFNATENEKLLI